MTDKKTTTPPMKGPLVTILLNSLKKAIGPMYQNLLEETPWQRYLKRPPSNDPQVVESNDEEFGLVCQRIYQVAGRDLFITFGRYAGIEAGAMLAAAVKAAVEPQIAGLSGIPRLQRAASIHMQFYAPQVGAFSIGMTDDGVEVINKTCGLCSLLKSDEPVCAFINDALRNSYTLLTGEQIEMKEVECQAQGKGKRCVFRATIGQKRR